MVTRRQFFELATHDNLWEVQTSKIEAFKRRFRCPPPFDQWHPPWKRPSQPKSVKSFMPVFPPTLQIGGMGETCFFFCSFEVRVHICLGHIVTMQCRTSGSSKVPKAHSIATRFCGIQSKARLNVTGHHSYCTNSIGTAHVSMALKVCSFLRVVVVAKQVL